ncbi:MAG: hypothetical protein COV43_02010 [Deltaproteobacteria bacterium CG11_big_fil_rev_8_21_14_0_20_42_23]|nr:MAG: hypothetical protein COV43_02010 [Deltaproteobacteria bacterium CG11_big_fil_rev_8_21_14_0_20_42_23]PJC63888.1 MAG: hypothetical protein CO021_07190 [Deltaproteobacteria bacterium CG_4_9_14_0_2_um_filter_42_21]
MKFLNNNEVSTINPHEEKTLLIDIREADEYNREHIPGSKNIPLSQLAQYDFSREKNKTAFFLCARGNRTKQAQDIIQNIGFEQVYCLEGGLGQWKMCGLETRINKALPLPLMQQVQIAAGSFVLLGLLLAVFISAWFLFLTAFIGSGLIFAGLTGWCGLAKLLQKLPFNRS